MSSPNSATCAQGWEALRGDPLPWLLDPSRPNLHWRALVELVGRPPDSPAARRARGGANAVEPVAGLLADLQPDRGWTAALPAWSPYGGPGWRLVAAVQLGADPEDPRLHTASERLLEEATGDGGLARPSRPAPDPRLTARALEAMVALGWSRHPRVQEWLAWLEADPGWEDDPVAAVAVLSAARDGVRPALMDRAADGLDRRLVASRGRSFTILGHPNLLRTDLAEMLAALAAAAVELRQPWRRLLRKLQNRQDPLGRWPRLTPVPTTLGAPALPGPSGFITLKATRAMLAYAAAAELPRLFPHPPSGSR
jgi:hypothetical protein